MPFDKSYFALDQNIIDGHTLVDLDSVMNEEVSKQIAETMPRMARPPPKNTKKSERRLQMEAQQKALEDRKKPAKFFKYVPKPMSAAERKAKDARLRKKRLISRHLMPKDDLDENKKIMAKIALKQNFLRNPRFNDPKTQLAANPTAALAGTLAVKVQAQPGNLCFANTHVYIFTIFFCRMRQQKNF